MRFIFLFFFMLYAYGEGITEAITHEWKDGFKGRNPYSYHTIRTIESLGIIGMAVFYSGWISFTLIPLYILVYRIFYCTERKELPLIKTIGKQAEGQNGIYRIKLFRKEFDIPFPSTMLQIISSLIGLVAFIML